MEAALVCLQVYSALQVGCTTGVVNREVVDVTM